MEQAHVVVPKRSLRPVLQNVKLAAHVEGVMLSATDLDVGIAIDLDDASVVEPGECLVPAAKLLAFLKECTDAEMSIEADDEACVVRGQFSSLTMSSEHPAALPDVPAFTEENYHELEVTVLRQLIQRSLFAAAVQDPRYALNGVLWELGSDRARLIATDGRRLAVAQGKAIMHGAHHTNGESHVVPNKAMELLERNLRHSTEVVHVNLGRQQAMFSTGRAAIHTRLIEGRFPPYQQVFPKTETIKISVAAGLFHTAIRQAAIACDKQATRVLFSFAEDGLILQAQVETTASKVEMSINYKAAPLDIAFNPEFLTNWLETLGHDDIVTLELVDSNTPGLFRQGDDYQYVVLPIAVHQPVNH
jgi:DNA polymerase-3 subunit beta